MRGQIYVQQAPPQAPQAPQAPAEPATDDNTETKEETPAPAQEAPARPQPELKRAAPERREDYSKYQTSRENLPGEAAQRAAAQGAGRSSQPTQPVKAGPRINRNDPCPCGSGKKYKNCHGRGL